MQQEILIIEDDADIAESLQYNFKRENFRVSVAESGRKACGSRSMKKPAIVDCSRFDASRNERNGTLPPIEARNFDREDTDYYVDRESRRN